MKEVVITICNTQFKVFLFPDGDIKIAPLDVIKAVHTPDSQQMNLALANENRQPVNPILTGTYWIEEAKRENMMAIHLLLFCVAKVVEDLVYEAELALEE